MSVLYPRVLANTYTTETAWHRFHTCRHALEAAVYTATTDQSVTERYQAALAEFDDETRAALIEWGTDWVHQVTAETLQTDMAAFQHWLERLPTFTLYVPVEMDQAGEVIIGTWCREHLGTELLVELVVDPQTVGGCAFVHNGTYHDWSLANRGEHELYEVITNVVTQYEA